MGFEQFLASIGLGSLIADEFFAAQVGVLLLTALFFLSSLILCGMAFRAAGSARRAESEAAIQARAAKDLAIEVRRLTAQVEKATTRRAATPVKIEPVAPPTEAEVHILSDEEREAQTALAETLRDVAPSEEEKIAETSLEAAKKAATIPSALLGPWRRKHRET